MYDEIKFFACAFGVFLIVATNGFIVFICVVECVVCVCKSNLFVICCSEFVVCNMILLLGCFMFFIRCSATTF